MRNTNRPDIQQTATIINVIFRAESKPLNVNTAYEKGRWIMLKEPPTSVHLSKRSNGPQAARDA